MSRKLYYLRGRGGEKPFSGKTETVDWADRWLADGLEVCETPGGAGFKRIDVSGLQVWMELQRQQGSPVSFIGVLTRAAGLAIRRHPHLHKIAVGRNRRHYPPHVDVGVSQAGETFVSSVILIENAEGKSAAEISKEITARQPEIARQEQKLLSLFRTWGWLVPLPVLRRMILRWLLGRVWFRKGAGVMQLSYIPYLPMFVANRFSATAILGIGGIHPEVIAVDGQAVVRPIIWASCAMNHRVWDGLSGARFFNEFTKILESVDPEL